MITNGGEDINLLIKTDQVDIDVIVRAEIAFLAKTQMKLGEQKIDVLLDYPSRKNYPPIFAIAKQIGILLWAPMCQYSGCKMHGVSASVIYITCVLN